jgi:hypothetical protein
MPDDDDAGAIGALHDIVEAVIKLGIDRFHQRHFLGLARQQIFAGDVGDMLPHVRKQCGVRRTGARRILCDIGWKPEGRRRRTLRWRLRSRQPGRRRRVAPMIG